MGHAPCRRLLVITSPPSRCSSPAPQGSYNALRAHPHSRLCPTLISWLSPTTLHLHLFLHSYLHPRLISTFTIVSSSSVSLLSVRLLSQPHSTPLNPPTHSHPHPHPHPHKQHHASRSSFTPARLGRSASSPGPILFTLEAPLSVISESPTDTPTLQSYHLAYCRGTRHCPQDGCRSRRRGSSSSGSSSSRRNHDS